MHRLLLSICLLALATGAGAEEADTTATLPTRHVPRIAGEWQELYRPDPETVGHYINDHTLLRHHDGSWHLIGITSKFPPQEGKENYLAHGIGSQLIEPEGYRDAPIIADHGEAAWAPHGVWHDGLWYLFYSPVSLKLITSPDLMEWSEPRVLFTLPWGDPNAVPFEPADPFRDAMVLQVDESRWLLYATRLATTDQPKNYSAVGLYESTDLIHWEDIGFALTTSGEAPYNLPYSSCESPFVMQYGEWYYLAFTYVEYGRFPHESYDNTLVFRSLRPNDPTDFGDWDGDPQMVVTRLAAHAPEFVQDPDQDGRWFITTCGWPDYPNPNPGAASIAPLEWDALEER